MKRIKSLILVLAVVVAGMTFSSCGSKTSKTDSMLNIALEQINKQLPTDLGDGLTMDKVELTPEYVVYNYTYDESEIPELAGDKEVMRAELKKQLEAGKDVRAFCEAVKETGRGIKYHYVGQPSGKEVDITFENDEL